MTAELHLHVFDYNYSSWSMRAGVLLRSLGVPFRETRVHLDTDGKAKLLEHGSLRIGDSLAIAEYLAELFPDKLLWPREREARALARAASCEMHSGFSAMRNTMNMNIRARYPGFARSPDVDRDVKRIQQLWTDLRTRYASQGDFLCGQFGIVDAMFAPVVTRFRTYDVQLPQPCADYADALFAHPAMRGWLDEADKDDFRVPQYEYVVG
jgi:glutathione S-transferase